ncbi:MAG: sensor domain-containing diguanylate cyclase [Lysobacteraceae bacterium]|nr:MAG: sensor domain-containing diguanylate cyclase [Xanthomonadaceae bacterium]
MELTFSLDAIQVPIFVVDVEPGPRFRIFGMNRAAEKEIGQSCESLAGLLFEDCLAPHKARMLTDRYAVCVRSRQSMHFDEIGEMSPNQDWYRTTLSPCVDEETGKVVRILTICQNITTTKRLAKAAFKDVLTGLPNRRGFETIVDDRCDEAAHSHVGFSLVVVDINDLKAINDTHGHGAGDDAIRFVGAWLTGLLLPGETVARVGGDEFHMMLEEPTPARLTQRLDRLREAAAAGLEIQQMPIRLSLSAGGSVWHLGDPVASILSAADAAMYAEKDSHRRKRSPAEILASLS